MTSLYTLEEIDRTLFEHIRRAVVEAGYLPDITQYTTEAAWIAARNTLRNNLPQKELIDVLGVSSSDDREEYTTSKIIINRTDETPGTIGGGIKQYENIAITGGGFITKEQVLPQFSTAITYEVKYNASNVTYERVISNIIYKVFDKICYLSSVKSDGTLDVFKKIEIKMLQKFDTSNMAFMEKNIIFRIDNVFLSVETNVTPRTVSHINTIDFYIHDHTVTDPEQGVQVTAE
jgi:hypothetical protein